VVCQYHQTELVWRRRKYTLCPCDSGRCPTFPRFRAGAFSSSAAGIFPVLSPSLRTEDIWSSPDGKVYSVGLFCPKQRSGLMGVIRVRSRRRIVAKWARGPYHGERRQTRPGRRSKIRIIRRRIGHAGAVRAATLASGPSRMTARSTVTSIGHGQPPPLGCGARDCVSRQRATHRSSVRWSTSNSAASRAYDPSPRSYAVTARSRSARSYGLGMAPLKYSSFGHSSGIRD
jgi:hypothetical protein